MARGAQHAAGVLGSDYLREAFGFGRILLMAAAAKVGHVGERRLVRRRIVSRRVQCQRTVARLAGHMGVPARGPRFALILVAQQAHVLPGVGNRALPDGIERTRAIVTKAAEPLGDHRRANYQKQTEPGQQYQRGANQMARVPKQKGSPFEQGISNTIPKRSATLLWAFSTR